MQSLTPKAIILNILRASHPHPLSTANILETGDVLGVSANNMRVSLTRLVASGLISSPSRGLYQLAAETNIISSYLESWRQGNKRIGQWDQSWLAAIPSKPYKHLKALERMGFREISAGLWARPNNLTLSQHQLTNILNGFQVQFDVSPFVMHSLNEAEVQSWKSLWPSEDTLNEQYLFAVTELQQSISRLPQQTLKQQLKETFLLGGEAIKTLMAAPLLPNDWIQTSALEQLTDAMLDYDVVGRNIWLNEQHFNQGKNIIPMEAKS